jgi:cell division protein FtsA
MFFFGDKGKHVVAALEVGSSKIAVAVAEIRPDHSLTLLGIGEQPSGKVRKCEILEMDVVSRCLHDALHDAEEKADVFIGEVYLAVSGAHIRSVNRRFTTLIDNEDDTVGAEDLNKLQEMAKSFPLPSEHGLIHDLRRHFYLDDGTVTDNPIGLKSKQLAAEYHLVHGLATRLKTTIQCVKDLSIEVKDYALSSYATAQAILTTEDKQKGAMVINLGGGSTDYIVYMKGGVAYSGVLGVGGDHMTQDISLGLKIGYSQAEMLKKTEGSVLLEAEKVEDKIPLPGDYGAKGRTIYRESLVTIMQARQAEVLEIIAEEMKGQAFWADFLGKVYLTGGASRVNGLQELAAEIFPFEVDLKSPGPFDGDQTYANRPDLSTVLGLLQYARKREREESQERGWKRMRRKLQDALTAIRLFLF